MINKIKAWDSLIDNDHVKRALEVALAGKHTIMVIGHKDNGFNHIKKLMDNAVCVEPCPCGCFGDSRHACHCTVSQIGKFRTSKKWRNAWESDISIQLLTPSTIAAIDHQAEIHNYHIAEAIQYKTGGAK